MRRNLSFKMMLFALLIFPLVACQPIQRLPESNSTRSSSGDSPVQEANKQVVSALLDEVFNKGNLAVIAQYIDPTCVGHQAFLGELEGQAGFELWGTNHWTGFKNPKLSFTLYASGSDRVFVDWSWEGGDLVDATKVYRVERAISMYRVKNGKVIEFFDMIDTLDLARQLGQAE